MLSEVRMISVFPESHTAAYTLEPSPEAPTLTRNLAGRAEVAGLQLVSFTISTVAVPSGIMVEMVLLSASSTLTCEVMVQAWPVRQGEGES